MFPIEWDVFFRGDQIFFFFSNVHFMLYLPKSIILFCLLDFLSQWKCLTVLFAMNAPFKVS